MIDTISDFTVPNRDVRLLHPKFKAELIPLLQALEAAYQARTTQFRFKLFEGWRSPLRQESLFKKGTTKARAWQSAHQYGLAADIVPMTGRGWTWDIDNEGWEFLANMARSFDLERPLSWDKAHIITPHWHRVKYSLIA